MSAQPLAIVGSGMVTGVGLSAPASCAAIRCALDNFQETRFMDDGGEWIIGCEVALEKPWRGITKLVKMLAMALRECATSEPGLELAEVPVLLCLAEPERPGRLQDLSTQVFAEVQGELATRFHAASMVIEQGHVGAVTALLEARRLIYGEKLDRVIVAGVDGFLVGATLGAYEARDRLLTSQNSDGFIPGEAAAAVLVRAPRGEGGELVCAGLGFGTEHATEDSGEPLRADGLVEAIRASLADAGCELGDLDFRITDISGSQYQFKEAALALSRVLRRRKEEFDIWHPADCIGEVGASMGVVIMGVALAAGRKAYSPGKAMLCHMGNEDGKRAAVVLGYA